MAWIILVSMCALVIIVKIKGYDVTLVTRYGVLHIEEIESDHVFYFSYYWVVLALLCIIVIWVRFNK